MSKDTLLFIGKLILSAITMGVIVFFINKYLCGNINDWAALNTFMSIVYLAILILSGAVAYFLTLVVLGVRPLSLLRK